MSVIAKNIRVSHRIFVCVYIRPTCKLNVHIFKDSLIIVIKPDTKIDLMQPYLSCFTWYNNAYFSETYERTVLGYCYLNPDETLELCPHNFRVV